MMRCGTGTASDFVLLVATPDQGEGKVYFFKLGAGSSMHSVKTHYSRRGTGQGVAGRGAQSKLDHYGFTPLCYITPVTQL